MKNRNGEKSISNSLLDNISDPNLGNTLSDVAEIAIDSIIDDGLLKDLPIIGSIVNISKATVSIRDKIFTKKILIFLKGLDSCPIKKREEFLKKISTNLKKKEKLGETLIVILDRLNDMNKSVIIANLFKAFIEENLTYQEFTKISNIVSNVQLDDLQFMRNNKKPMMELPKDILEYLAMNGLMNIGLISPTNSADMQFGSSIYYVPNELAHKLFKFGF